MISIAMTTYNGEKYLYEQIKSILNQSYQDFELIIVDDCSSDLTRKILKSELLGDSRIHIYLNKENIGFLKNFEKAISYCNGDYIAFADQDDIWDKEHLSILMSNIGDNLMVCSNSTLFEDNEEKEICNMNETLSLDFIPKKDDMFFYLLYNNFVQGSASMIHRNLLKKVNKFPMNTAFFHDHWLALYAAEDNKLLYLDISTLKYRQHESNVTDNRKRSFVNYLKKKGRNISEERYQCLSEYHTNNADRFKLIEDAMDFYKQHSFLQKLGSCFFLMKNYKKMYSVNSYRFLLSRIIKLFLG